MNDETIERKTRKEHDLAQKKVFPRIVSISSTFEGIVLAPPKVRH